MNISLPIADCRMQIAKCKLKDAEPANLPLVRGAVRCVFFGRKIASSILQFAVCNMQFAFFIVTQRSVGLAVLLAAASPAWAQRSSHLQFMPPHLGYVYPAGARQGSTVEVTVGGQFLRDVTGAHVWGEGLQVTVGKYHKPFVAEDYFRLQEKLKEIRPRLQAEMAKNGPSAARAAYPKILRELGVTEEDIKEVREFVDKATNPKRQRNYQLAESVTLKIKVSPNAALGERELRLMTAAGLSNPLVFQVGAWPECGKGSVEIARSETEVHETLPVTLNGQILAGGADRFTFRATKGTKLLAVACARDLMPYLADAVPGWFQASLTLYDAQGNEVAYADDYRFQADPVLRYLVPADGRYTLEVRDALYRGREDFVYRITLGAVPFVTSIFPLGAHDATRASVSVKGWNLPNGTLTVGGADKGLGIRPISLRTEEPAANRVLFARDTLPECLEQEPNNRPAEAQTITLPVIVNGRIDRPGDQDLFRFEGHAGAEIVAEVLARRLGSPLDSLLKLTDQSGRTLAMNDDHEDKGTALLTHHADSRLSVKLPANGSYYLHVSDTQHKGGDEYAYRLRVGPPRPDFELRVTPSSVNGRAGTNAPVTVYALRRDGFDGDIALELKDAPSGFTLNSALLPAHQDKVRLTVALPTTHNEQPIRLTIQGRAMVAGRRTLRTAVPAEDMIQAFAYHQLAPVKELLVLVRERRFANIWWRLPSEERVTLRPGSTAQVRFLAPSGLMTEQAQLTLSEPPDGISVERSTPTRGGVALTLHADAKAKPGLKGNLIFEASFERTVESDKAKAKGGKLRIPVGSLPAVPFQIVGS